MGVFDKLRGRHDDQAALKAQEQVIRGESFKRAGRMQEALQEFQGALKLDVNCADAYYGLGRCYHHFARQENERAGGNIYFRAGLENLNQAIAAFEHLVKLQPNAADGYFNLGLAYDNHARLEEAEHAYREAIRLDPVGMDGADAYSNLSLLLYMRAMGLAGLKQFPQIIMQVRNSDPALDPAFDPAFAEAEKGIVIGEEIVKSDASFVPNLIQHHRRLAGWYDRFLQGSKAIEHYQAVLRLDPQDQEAREWLKLAERNTGRKLL